jgi:hypothetical protein
MPWPFSNPRREHLWYLERIAKALEKIADRREEDRRLAEALHTKAEPLNKAVEQNKGT